MKKFTKLMALLLALIMMLSLAACAPASNDDSQNSGDSSDSSSDAAPTAPNRAILGNTTELSGDFRYPGWGGSSAGAADRTSLVLPLVMVLWKPTRAALMFGARPLLRITPKPRTKMALPPTP